MAATRRCLQAVREIQDARADTTIYDLTFMEGFTSETAKGDVQAELKRRWVTNP
jgi:hypothetical protein